MALVPACHDDAALIRIHRALDRDRLRRGDHRAEALVGELRHSAPPTATLKRLPGCTVNVLISVVPSSRRNVIVTSADSLFGFASRM